MKLFIKTLYHEGFRGNILTGHRYCVDLIAIALATERGEFYYAINKDFRGIDLSSSHPLSREIEKLPPRIHPSWKRLRLIREEILAWLASVTNGGVGDLYCYESPTDHLLLTGLYGGASSPGLPDAIPRFCINLEQSLWEYCDFMEDMLFLSEDYLDFIDAAGQPYDLHEKMAMLFSHREFPTRPNPEGATVLDQALWMVKLERFYEAHRQQTYEQYRQDGLINRIADETDNH